MPISYDDANYTPPMRGYSGQGAFRFWCQTVLPIVYNDSLSYYELLNKVVVYLNNTISDVANVEDNVQDLHDAYVNLQGYVNETYNELTSFVNNYFDNLDVQTEIDNKLDEMAESGVLSALINPLIPSAVSDWLRDNITPTTPVVDATLSIEGAAADAKTTGDKIGELKNEINNVFYAFPYFPEFEQGTISNTGVYGDDFHTIRTTVEAFCDRQTFLISCAVGYTYAVRYFDSESNFISGVSFDSNPGTYIAPVGAAKIGICLRSTNTITPEARSNISIYTIDVNMTESLQDLDFSVHPKLAFVSGTINQDGTENNNANRIRAYIDAAAYELKKIRLACASGYTYAVRFYDASGTVLQAVAFTAHEKIYTLPAGTVKIGVVLNSSSTIDPSYSDNLYIGVEADSGFRYLLDTLSYAKLNFLEYEQGSLSGNDGLPVNDAKTIRTMLDVNNVDISYIRAGCESGYTYALRYYDNTGALISSVAFTATENIYVIPTETVTIGICLRSTENISISAASNIYVYVSINAASQITNNRIEKLEFLGVDVDSSLASKLADVIEYNRDQKFANIGYYTDTHSNVNDCSFAIRTMNDIMATKMMNHCIHGGDLITTYDLDYDEYILAMCENMIYYKVYGSLLFVKGNHDNNHAEVLGDNATKYQYHMMMQSHLTDAMFNPADPCACYFYVDCPHELVRIIVLDTFTVEGNSGTVAVDSAQNAWLYSTALDVEDKWTVIVFAHQFNDTLTDTINILNAFRDRGTAYGSYEFSDDITTQFVGVVHGHEHTDSYSNALGFNNIGVKCAYGVDGAVDILTVDTVTHQLYETRIGGGDSRVFAFDAPSQVIT